MYSSLVRCIEKFPNAEWNYNVLSSHPNVSLITLKKMSEKPWNWKLLTSNVNWNWNWVREFPDKEWNWVTISKSNNFHWDWVREFPDKPWCWNTLSENVDGIHLIKYFPDKPWCWYSLTTGPGITIEEMIENPNFPWTVNQLLFTDIDENELKFIRFYRSHYDYDAWCDHTSRTPWKIIKNNMDLPWVFDFVKISNDFQESDIKYLYKHKWNWKHLSEVLDFDKIISMCMDLPWDFEYVSRNKSVTFRHVEIFSECKWNYNVINLDYDKKHWIAAETIKRFWKRCATDPSYSMCRKLVLRDLMGALDVRNHPSHNQR